MLERQRIPLSPAGNQQESNLFSRTNSDSPRRQNKLAGQGSTSQLTLSGVSDNVGGVKSFLSVLMRALRRARHFALFRKSAVPTKGSLPISCRSGNSVRPMH